ncbi:hypothetical protein EYF80_036209 [Liparis tanakae]|uniref:Uncharacterized protein n=1 Tax=Liparis tanakae TaxID=230148 RepID=A0A4Z2GJC4_9TELE|nr:hypothetical protein EYF80_036209 [Liparis tanakae]
MALKKPCFSFSLDGSVGFSTTVSGPVLERQHGSQSHVTRGRRLHRHTPTEPRGASGQTVLLLLMLATRGRGAEHAVFRPLLEAFGITPCWTDPAQVLPGGPAPLAAGQRSVLQLRRQQLEAAGPRGRARRHRQPLLGAVRPLVVPPHVHGVAVRPLLRGEGAGVALAVRQRVVRRGERVGVAPLRRRAVRRRQDVRRLGVLRGLVAGGGAAVGRVQGVALPLGAGAASADAQALGAARRRAAGRREVQAAGGEVARRRLVAVQVPVVQVAHRLGVAQRAVALGQVQVGEPGGRRGAVRLGVAVAPVFLPRLQRVGLALHEGVAVLVRAEVGLEVLGPGPVRPLGPRVRLALGLGGAQQVGQVAAGQVHGAGGGVVEERRRVALGVQRGAEVGGRRRVAVQEAVGAGVQVLVPRQAGALPAGAVAPGALAPRVAPAGQTGGSRGHGVTHRPEVTVVIKEITTHSHVASLRDRSSGRCSSPL